jgi:hypothetical protein
MYFKDNKKNILSFLSVSLGGHQLGGFRGHQVEQPFLRQPSEGSAEGIKGDVDSGDEARASGGVRDGPREGDGHVQAGGSEYPLFYRKQGGEMASFAANKTQLC